MRHTKLMVSFRGFLSWGILLACVLSTPTPSRALPAETLQSVVSVLPVWPGYEQAGADTRPGRAPEGSGVVIRPGIIATAWHVIEPAERIDIRLSDGRILPSELIGKDAATDIALLSFTAELPVFVPAARPALAERSCAIGNAWGLGLSVTCGVVSALDVTDAGFNPVEDFIQTDAAANPGVSGGALVDSNGHLLGMMSAIFASDADANIGVNFAVSIALLERVTDALLVTGAVTIPQPNWRLSDPNRAQLAVQAAPIVAEVTPGSAAAIAGITEGDAITMVNQRRVRTRRDVVAALALLPEGAGEVPVTLQRDAQTLSILLPLNPEPRTEAVAEPLGDCPHARAVCQMRQIVFPISSFDPVGSATRIGETLLVTNRHIVGNLSDAIVHTPQGPVEGRVVPSAYLGDLVLIEVDGLPADGAVPSLDAAGDASGITYAIGADIARQEIRVFDPGQAIAPPADGAELGRLHVTSYMQPGVSGGALVDETGTLVGINVGGGEGRYEAIPLDNVRRLLELRETSDAVEITERLGAALAACVETLETLPPRQAAPSDLDAMAEVCAISQNYGQLLSAGRALAEAGRFDQAVALHTQAVEQVPNALNARLSLLVSLQLSARFEDMVPHARRVMEMAGDDPQVLRFAIQSGVWGDAPELAEDAYDALLTADPRQAQAARRFIDSAPPAPVRR